MSTHYRAMAMIVVLILAGACGAPRPTAAPLAVASTNTSLPPTATPVPVTNTPLPPTATTAPPAAMVVSPTDTVLPVPSPTPTIPPVEVIQDILYIPTGDNTQKLDLYLPTEGEGPFPTLFMIAESARKEAFAFWSRHFAKQGYAAISIGHRDWPDHGYPSNVADAFCALAWVQANAATYGFETSQLFVLGHSDGATLASMLGVVDDPTSYMADCPYPLLEPNRLQGVIAVAGIFDFAAFVELYASGPLAPGLFMGLYDAPELWTEASPITQVSGNEPAFLIVHGTDDLVVPADQSQNFALVLEEAGADVELVLVPVADHHTQIVRNDETLQAIEVFLERQLEQPKAVTLDVQTGIGGVAFADSGQSLDAMRSWDVALGDLDGDGDLDAFVANSVWSHVWLNDGQAAFTNSEQKLGTVSGLQLGDLDGDGDLDAFTVDAERGSVVWLNDGAAVFAAGQRTITATGYNVSLGDVDGDSDLDAYIAGEGANTLWLNDGQGEFTAGRQRFAGDRSIGAILADLDSDGDLDVFEIVYNGLHRVWFNDGTGTFTNSGQVLKVGTGNSHGAALGDLDGDGDLDAFVTVADKMAFQVWFNDGAGIFTNSGQSLPSSNAQMVALGDLDGDGDLDAFMTNTGNSDAGAGNTVWLNDGQGVFSDSGLRLGHEYSIGIALGDLDGDGDLDAFVANSNFADPAVDRANKVWLNFSAPLPETLPAGDEP